MDEIQRQLTNENVDQNQEEQRQHSNDKVNKTQEEGTTYIQRAGIYQKEPETI